MKNTFSYFTLFLLISCGQVSKPSEDQKLDENMPATRADEVKVDEPEVVEAPKLIGTGTITTIADGFDVQRVNLFNSTTSNRSINCFLSKGEKVNILRDEDPYYLVQSVTNNNCKGYCMKGFVVIKK